MILDLSRGSNIMQTDFLALQTMSIKCCQYVVQELTEVVVMRVQVEKSRPRKPSHLQIDHQCYSQPAV